MPYDRFFIAPFDKNSGFQNDVKPFLIPDEAFQKCENAYQWRGRVRKRFGTRWLGPTQALTRLKIDIGDTDPSGNAGPLPVPGIIYKPGQAFSIGTEFFTVYQDGDMYTTGASTLHTYNLATGFVHIMGAAPSTTIYFYPAEPVMGLRTYIQGQENFAKTVAFDTQFAYDYQTTGWERIAGEADVGAAIWTGDNSQLFWSTTYGGTNANDYTLFVTNFNELEPNFMRFLFNNQWNNFDPIIQNVPVSLAEIRLVSAAILVTFKNRLVAFNVWEQNFTVPAAPQHYPFRIRWSKIGDPTATNVWRDDIKGQGGVIDLPDLESIITVEFIKDRCIVFCENQTWELVYIGNQIQPFTFQKINTELGAESRFSEIPFDKVVLGIAQIGIHACNGTNVERIDNDIPDEVFNIHTEQSGPERVFGIRDYTVEMAYWTFPDDQRRDTQVFPDRILVYNYKTNTWSMNDDSITCFGYIQQITGPDWSSQTIYWYDTQPWNNGPLQSVFRRIIAGNQEGFTFLVDANVTTNDTNLQITNITGTGSINVINFTVVDHNLSVDDYVFFTGITSTGNMTLFNLKIFQVRDIIDEDNFEVLYEDDIGSIIAGTYSGGGVIATVSKIDILTKQFNFYFKEGRNSYIPKVDFLVDRTFAGQITLDYFVSTSPDSMVLSSEQTNSIVGTNILETSAYASVPFESTATQVWHPVYFQADGEFIQLRLYLNDDQMRNTLVRLQDFQLNAMTIYSTPTSQRNQ